MGLKISPEFTLIINLLFGVGFNSCIAYVFDSELEQCVVLEKPSAVIYGGLRGFSAAYRSGDTQYCETHLGISGIGDDQTGLIILISTHGKLPTKAEIEKLMNAISPRRE